jgi:hypothetical protein
VSKPVVLEPDFHARIQAVRRLVEHDPRVDPLLALSFALWPTEAIENAPPPARGRGVSSAEAERMAELAAEGLSHRRIGELMGRPRTTVSLALRRRRAAASPGPNLA